MLFQCIYIHVGPCIQQIKINQRLRVFEVPWSPLDFVSDPPPRAVFENSPSDHEP